MDGWIVLLMVKLFFFIFIFNVLLYDYRIDIAWYNKVCQRIPLYCCTENHAAQHLNSLNNNPGKGHFVLLCCSQNQKAFSADY